MSLRNEPDSIFNRYDVPFQLLPRILYALYYQPPLKVYYLYAAGKIARSGRSREIGHMTELYSITTAHTFDTINKGRTVFMIKWL